MNAINDITACANREQDENLRTPVAHERAQSDLSSEQEIVAAATRVNAVESGVYFLILDGKIVYVGQTKHIGARIASHALNQSWRPFDSWSFLPCPADSLLALEADYIKAIKPSYNGTQRRYEQPQTKIDLKDSFGSDFFDHMSDDEAKENQTFQIEAMDRMAYLRAMKLHRHLPSPFTLSPDEIRNRLEELGLSTG